MTNPVGTTYYMSPETLKKRYDQSCDVWSTGIVAYILMCGYPPFNGETDEDIFEAIKLGHFIFHSQTWDHITSEAKDFITCLLRKDPRKRFTAFEALQHPWISNLGRLERISYNKQREERFSLLRKSNREELQDLVRRLKNM